MGGLGKKTNVHPPGGHDVKDDSCVERSQGDAGYGSPEKSWVKGIQRQAQLDKPAHIEFCPYAQAQIGQQLWRKLNRELRLPRGGKQIKSDCGEDGEEG